MKKTRFSEEQIIAVLPKQDGGMKTADVCREHGISSATLYAWEAKYGSMDVSRARQLKVLEEENGRRKRLLADAMLDNTVSKEVAGECLALVVDTSLSGARVDRELDTIARRNTYQTRTTVMAKRAWGARHGLPIHAGLHPSRNGESDQPTRVKLL